MSLLAMSTSATYQIIVKGSLDAGWSKRLGGMLITPLQQDSQDALTLLVGEMADQDMLFGVLLALYDLRLPLLCVYCAGSPAWQTHLAEVTDRNQQEKGENDVQ